MHFIPVDEDTDNLAWLLAEADRTLAQYGLLQQGWEFKLSNGINQVGWCWWSKKVIAISKRYIDNSPREELRDVLLHEVAHALQPAERILTRRGYRFDIHGPKWKAKAREVGARPNRCTEFAVIDAENYRWLISCPSCGRSWKRHRLKRMMHTAICPACKVQLEVREL
jgi:predicted SprT family Zn-dependent metalloprotease